MHNRASFDGWISETRYQQLFALAPVGHLETDLSGVITRVNHVAAAMLKRPGSELLGQRLSECIAQPDRRQFERRVCELVENPESGEWQTRLVQPDSVITISVGLSVTMEAGDGEPRGMRWVVRDLRELRRAQSEAMAHQDSLRRSAARAEEPENRLRRIAVASSRSSSRGQ
jgi:PAS domain S-box-containing protein